MDFNSLCQGNALYVFKKSEKPILLIGTVKTKTNPQPKFGQGVNNIFQNVVNITVSYENGKEETFTDVPTNAEVAQTDDANTIFSGSETAMTSVIDGIVATSAKVLESIKYHKQIVDNKETWRAMLNPHYAKEQEREKSLAEMERRQAATEKMLEKIQGDNTEILGMLKKLMGGEETKK